MTKQDRQSMMLKMAHDGATAWIDELIEHHKRAARDLEGYRARFVEACAKQTAGERDTTPVEVLSWTVNQVNNIRQGGRLDLAVNHASALALAAAGVAKW
jgi:hypothetical protein